MYPSSNPNDFVPQSPLTAAVPGRSTASVNAKAPCRSRHCQNGTIDGAPFCMACHAQALNVVASMKAQISSGRRRTDAPTHIDNASSAKNSNGSVPAGVTSKEAFVNERVLHHSRQLASSGATLQLEREAAVAAAAATTAAAQRSSNADSQHTQDIMKRTKELELSSAEEVGESQSSTSSHTVRAIESQEGESTPALLPRNSKSSIRLKGAWTMNMPTKPPKPNDYNLRSGHKGRRSQQQQQQQPQHKPKQKDSSSSSSKSRWEPYPDIYLGEGLRRSGERCKIWRRPRAER